MTTVERLHKLLAQRFALRAEELAPECTLESLGIDSLGATNIRHLDGNVNLQCP